jgi:glucosamine--fructose-6-phosphate aminotransferase (isomerizing)
MTLPTNTPLWADIQAQGENLRQVLDHLLGPAYTSLQEAAAFVRNDLPLALVGLGSAAYLCLPAVAHLNEYGRFARLYFASEALYGQLPALRRANVVINSRSGATVEVVRLAQDLVAAGIPYLAITNDPTSPLAQGAACLIDCRSRADDLVSINIVSAMLAITGLWAAEALGQLSQLRPALARLPEALSQAVQSASAQAEALAEAFAGLRAIYLLYRGAAAGAAWCGRLVLEEVARTPAVACEMADFRQGAIEVLDASIGVVLFIPQGQLRQLSLRLARQLLAAGATVLAIGRAADLVPLQGRALLFALPPAEPEPPAVLLPLLQLVPLQLLAYALAARQGYRPGVTRYLPKVITSEENIPNL